jgi:hypothetical protein
MYDDAKGALWLMNRTEQVCGYVTYANIWVNSHCECTSIPGIFELSQNAHAFQLATLVSAASAWWLPRLLPPLTAYTAASSLPLVSSPHTLHACRQRDA